MIDRCLEVATSLRASSLLINSATSDDDYSRLQNLLPFQQAAIDFPCPTLTSYLTIR